MDVYGLLGYPLLSSFSQQYFEDKFRKENSKETAFKNFVYNAPRDFIEALKEMPEVKGFSVTIPHKQSIIPFLDLISDDAKAIGAVNAVRVKRFSDSTYQLIGFNTDVFGFEKSFLPIHKIHQFKQAIVIGTGGSAKAIASVLKNKSIPFVFISRNKKEENTIAVKDLKNKLIEESIIIINCTPVGMAPNIDLLPPFDYELIRPSYFLFDLIYNPAETKFMYEGIKRGAKATNGMEMLILQAEESWKIWNQK